MFARTISFVIAVVALGAIAAAPTAALAGNIALNKRAMQPHQQLRTYRDPSSVRNFGRGSLAQGLCLTCIVARRNNAR